MTSRRPSAGNPFDSLGEALTRDLDGHKFKFLHPRHIPLVESPLVLENAAAAAAPVKHEGSEGSESLKEPTSEVAPGEGTPPHGHLHHRKSHIEAEADEPLLRYESESSTIQLFYDLFFVANLTTFGSRHEVSDGQTLRSYLAFFTLLWFTWFQVALFDIRFGHDSAFERVCKAIQFGVMVALSVEGSIFTFEDFEDYKDVFRALSLILMVSRFVLAVQYLATWSFLTKYKKAHFPLFVHVATLFISGLVFLGLSFAFVGKPGIHASYGWWVILPIEALVILYVSGNTSFLNFRKTNIRERLGLLTLIILGEGVMGLGESIAKIQKIGDTFSSDIIGTITACVLIVYFLYMLYFDQIETEITRIGTLSSEIWTLLHFPFHVCILLVVEGFNQLTIWRKIVDYTNTTLNAYVSVAEPTEQTAEAFEAYAQEINSTLSELWSEWDGIEFEGTVECIETYFNDTETLELLCPLEAQGAVASYFAELYEVEVPEAFSSNVTDEALDSAINIPTLYSTVYLYFFISAGLALILLGLLFILGKKKKTRIEWISIGIRLFVGTAISLLAAFYADDRENFNVFSNFFGSAWLVPTVALAYGLVVLMDALISLFSRSVVDRREKSFSVA